MPKMVREPAILNPAAGTAERVTKVRRQEALQRAIFNSAHFSSIATDAKGVIQIFNVGAERMLGYMAADVMNKITPADLSDPQEVIARAQALSVELGTPITPGFEALVFKASRGIEDIYELTYIRKDGSRFPAVVSVTALRDAQNAIIGYLLIGTDNTARKEVEAARALLDQRLATTQHALEDLNQHLEQRVLEQTAALQDSERRFRTLVEDGPDLVVVIDARGAIAYVSPSIKRLGGYEVEEILGPAFLEFTHPEDRAHFAADIAEVLGVADLEET